MYSSSSLHKIRSDSPGRSCAWIWPRDQLSRLQPLGLSESPLLMSTQPVGTGGRPVSAMHASRSLSSRTFSSSMYCISKLSRFLDHLRVQRQSNACVSELLITVSIVRVRQQLRLLQSWSSLHCCDCQLSVSSHHSLGLAASRGSHALSQSTQYRCHQPLGGTLFTRFRSAAQQLDVIVSAKTVSVHGVRDVLIRHESRGLARQSHVRRTDRIESFRTGTDRIEHNACRRSTSASISTAPPTPPRDTQRERVYLARFAFLPGCMQTPGDACPALAVLPTRLAWCVVAEREREPDT